MSKTAVLPAARKHSHHEAKVAAHKAPEYEVIVVPHRSEHAAKITGHKASEKASERDDVDYGHAKKKRERVPPRAVLWGFVQNNENIEPGVKRDPEPAPHDAMLWFDRISHRFLIEVDKFVVDSITPLQFIHLVRELRNIETRVLFKYERKFDGTVGAPRRVWAR
jgi:hypothetical protein